LQFRPAGKSGWKLLRKLHTKADGGFRAQLHARRSGSFRVDPAQGRISTREPVRVRALTTFHLEKHNAKVGEGVALSGRVLPAGPRPVKVVIRGAESEVLSTETKADGTFSLPWEPTRAGGARLRAHIGGNEVAAGATSATRSATTFRAALASWYGPGFYGNRTGCGQTLAPGMLGVAHKSLPCGTKVTFRYHGRSVRAPVIDRGPYVGDREFDLTATLKQRLGFPSTGIVYVSH